MAQRALVLGSQIEGLRGVHNDTARMAAMLEARGFVVDLRTGDAATRAGILAGYDRLIEDSAAGDAAVVYYCGHGAHASVPEEGRAWQCIVPTDLRQGAPDDWRGITAWELSIKQKQLTDRTRNVTVILDCCHSAQMCRDDVVPGAIPRALPHPVQAGFARHLAQLRARYGAAYDAVDAIGNRDAVRLVACGRTEVAFEYADAGEHRGVFTDAVIEVLTQVGAATVSWAAIREAIRARVQRLFVRQRPDIEGPVRRGLFSLTEHADGGGVAITQVGAGWRLPVGRLTGGQVGDVYSVMPFGSAVHRDADQLAELEVMETFATTSLARCSVGGPALPCDAVAIPIRRTAVTWAVAIDVAGEPRTAVEAAIAGSRTLRVAEPGDVALATLRLSQGVLTVEDARGSRFAPARFPAELGGAISCVTGLGVAQGLRELEGEHGVRADELVIELGIVDDGQPRALPDHGSLLTVGDRYYVKLDSRSRRPLFVHVLNLSARGKITLLTDFERGGVCLDRRDPSMVLGQRGDGAFIGTGMRWPDGLPRNGLPTLEELIVVATLAKTDLTGLETQTLALMRSGGNPLHKLLVQLHHGGYRDVGDRGELDGFFAKRLSVLLAPDARPSVARAIEAGQ